VDSLDRTDLPVSTRTKIVFGTILGVAGFVLLVFFA
jgi:hypothetical protein